MDIHGAWRRGSNDEQETLPSSGSNEQKTLPSSGSNEEETLPSSGSNELETLPSSGSNEEQERLCVNYRCTHILYSRKQ